MKLVNHEITDLVITFIRAFALNPQVPRTGKQNVNGDVTQTTFGHIKN